MKPAKSHFWKRHKHSVPKMCVRRQPDANSRQGKLPRPTQPPPPRTTLRGTPISSAFQAVSGYHTITHIKTRAREASPRILSLIYATSEFALACAGPPMEPPSPLLASNSTLLEHLAFVTYVYSTAALNGSEKQCKKMGQEKKETKESKKKCAGLGIRRAPALCFLPYPCRKDCNPGHPSCANVFRNDRRGAHPFFVERHPWMSHPLVAHPMCLGLRQQARSHLCIVTYLPSWGGGGAVEVDGVGWFSAGSPCLR